LVGGADGEPEVLLLLERPCEGRVRVRSWTSNDWGTPPIATERDAGELLRDVERWTRAGRSLNHPLTVVRRWLESDVSS
jgi:hypothetical protein